MRVKATIETIRVLALQGLGFRGHDESSISLNQGNLIELLKFKARGNDALESIILKNAPQNAKYTSPKIQKEILYILANRVRNMIFDEVAEWYDGASNMLGEWNGLQALFLKDCPYAYYVHYFAYRLQLALIAAAKDEPNVWQFFSHLSCIVNLVASSPKYLGELKCFHRSKIENMLASDERQSVVESLKKSTNQQICGQANGAYKDIYALRCQLMHYKLDVVCDLEFYKISTLAKLCRELFVIGKFEQYTMIYKLTRLVSILYVSTTTKERAFSGMKHVKTSIRNSMEDEFLADCLSLDLE
ncbi:uncharacterized protein LOC114275408 [Camellia sinensis]|uniref:uncharacterized protein LOC114275408 n=1 Tax=Camellia sinensis TaxID=4442 RepID=UPI001036CCDE|nr:uncharacterized protein LOC114275408 [Camellia sinensis]